MLTGFEVLALNRFLRGLDASRDEPRFDRHALFHSQTLKQVRHPLLGEDAHQVIFQRQVETRRARVALAASASTELIVYAARLVAFGAKDKQAAK